MKAHLALPILAALVCAGGVARAQGDNTAIAEGLFDDARHLVDAGKFDEACPKFAESLRLSPTLGTRLNLAHCYELQGKIASAWGEYKELARLATHDRKRLAIAKERVAAIEPQLPHTTITGAADVGTTMKLDGKTLDAAVLGTSFAIDPGDHTLEVSAPKKKTSTTHFHVDPGETKDVAMPALEDAAPPPPPPTPKVTTPPPAEQPHYETSQPKLIGGWVAVGGGAAVLGAGIVFGVMTLSLAGEVNDACPGGPCPTQDALDKNSSAHTFAVLSDVLIPVGVAAAAVGAYLVATAKHHVTPTIGSLGVAPAIGRNGGGITVGGRF